MVSTFQFHWQPLMALEVQTSLHPLWVIRFYFLISSLDHCNPFYHFNLSREQVDFCHLYVYTHYYHWPGRCWVHSTPTK
jgi:hypothetical protein